MSTSCYKKNVFFSLSRLYIALYMRNSRRFRFVLLANSEFIYNGAFCRLDLEITLRRKGAAPLSGAEEQTARGALSVTVSRTIS